MSKAPILHERSFGLTVGTACALFAALGLWRGHLVVAKGMGIAAVLLLVPALLRPSLLAGPAALWTKFSHGLGWVNARVLLSALFLLVLTPLAVVLRAVGWDPLRLRHARRGSGWVPCPARHRDPKHYERMY